MKTADTVSLPSHLPITRDLTLAFVASLLIALIMAIVSAAGLLFQSDIYPEEELIQAFVAVDVVNLVMGVPILLGSMWLARRGRLIGLLLWPGALFFVIYNYIVYVFGMPLHWIYPLYLTLLALSIYTTINLVASIDGQAIQERLAGSVPTRAIGGTLAALGVLFLFLAIGELTGSLVNQTAVPETERALWVTDFLISPAWIIGGVLLWRRRALGYVSGVGLLFQASMLFIGLIMLMLLQPLLANAPIVLTDVVVTFIFGLIAFIPLTLFVRAVVSS